MKNKERKIAASIKKVVETMMDRVLDNVLKNDPFVVEEFRASKPLYAALVPEEIFKCSHFERRFVTPFGKLWEVLAQVVAKEEHGSCEMGKKISGVIPSERMRRIQEVLNRLEHKTKGKERIKPNWSQEVSYVLKGKGNLIPVEVTCDILVHNLETQKKYSFEIKAPLPNSDQTKVSKEKMLKLLAMKPTQVDNVYFALPYNPYGKKEDYAWTFPMRWFDMYNDESVLIGNEFWDLIGGKGTYKTFLQEINKLGNKYRDTIYRQYLLIEPPKGNKRIVLK